MKMDQLAFYCATTEQADAIKRQFGLLDKDWVKDTVTATVNVRGEIGENTAELQFNYDLGIEFEILRYVNGPHWTQHHDKAKPYLAHVGLHLDEGEVWPLVNWELVQAAKTFRHTAQHLIDLGRTYEYRIYQVSDGSYVKYIKRVNRK